MARIELALCYLAGKMATEQQIDYYRTTCHGHYHPWIIPFVAHVTKTKRKQGNTRCSSYPRQDRQSWVFRTFPPSTLATPIAMYDWCGTLYASAGLSSSRPRFSPFAASSSSSSSSSSSPPWYSRCAPAGTQRPLSRSFKLLSWPERSCPTPSPICL